MLEEAGLYYETVVLDFKTTMKSPEYLAINPMGKVPTIQHRKIIVTETSAICAYLAELVPEKKSYPPFADAQRGDYYRWFFTAAPLEAALMEKLWNIQLEDNTRFSLGYGNLGLVVKTLIKNLQNSEYICEMGFSAANLYLSSFLDFGIYFTHVLDEHPIFVDYIKRCQNRPSFIHAKTLDKQLLACL